MIHGWGWFLLPLLALFCYGPGLFHPFVYDDHGVIVEQSFLTTPGSWLKVVSLRTLADPEIIDGQRPVLLATYLLDRHLWGLQPAGWRFTNLGLHGLCLVLFALLLGRMGLDPAPAGALGLLMGVHPLMVEAVQSPSFREDLLCALFVLSFLLAGLAWVRGSSRGSLVLAAGFMVLALLAKEAAVAAPVLLGILVWLDHRHPVAWGRLAGVTVVAAACITALGVYGYSGRPVQAAGGAWNGRALLYPDNLFTAPVLFSGYLVKLLAPLGLSIDYTVTPVAGVADPRFWVGLTVLSVVVALVLGWLPLRGGWGRIGLAWILVWFAPVSNLVPLFNPMADRYAYGMVLGAGFVAAGIGRSRVARPWPAVLLAGLGLWWVSLTVTRLDDWKSDRAIWSAALEVNPRSDRAHTWLGLLAAQSGDADSAREHYLAARSLNPRETSAAVNLAILEGKAGNLDEAERLLLEVLSRDPSHRPAQQNLQKVEQLRR
ncbi:MAG: tetratricopeptide repeat protein [Kiritimatiellae bacterium]|nr:tetratricopeptide repeat protein [Kiritimatiellia bacterium]